MNFPSSSITGASPIGHWLDHSGLNEGDVALARAHWHSAERLVAGAFAIAAALHLGPSRLDGGLAGLPAHVRSV
jgi:hypothetical protein